MKAFGFHREVRNFLEGICPGCEKPGDEKTFRDEISRKEFKISGFCRKCQNKVFGGPKE